MSVGGRIIEIKKVGPKEWRLWVMDKYPPNVPDEVCVHTKHDPSMLELGDEIWWHSGTIYAKSDTVRLPKYGNSYDPNRS